MSELNIQGTLIMFSVPYCHIWKTNHGQKYRFRFVRNLLFTLLETVVMTTRSERRKMQRSLRIQVVVELETRSYIHDMTLYIHGIGLTKY